MSFLEGVVGHWEDRVAVASFNFSQLFLTIMRIETLVILQVATVLALWLLAWRSNCRPAVSVAWDGLGRDGFHSAESCCLGLSVLASTATIRA